MTSVVYFTRKRGADGVKLVEARGDQSAPDMRQMAAAAAPPPLPPKAGRASGGGRA